MCFVSEARVRVKAEVKRRGVTLEQVSSEIYGNKDYLSKLLSQPDRLHHSAEATWKLLAWLGWGYDELHGFSDDVRPPPWEIAIWYWADRVSVAATRRLRSEGQREPGRFSDPVGWGDRLWEIQEGLSPRDKRSTVRPAGETKT